MTDAVKREGYALIGGLVLAALVEQSVFASGFPTLSSPQSLLLFVVILRLDAVIPALGQAAVTVIPGLLFYLASKRDPEGRHVRGVVAAAVVVGLLSAIYFATGWREAVKHEGLFYTAGTAVISAGFAILAGMLSRMAFREQSRRALQWLRFVLIAWIVTYAFPWLGELI